MNNTSQDKNIFKGYNMLLYFAGSMILHEPTEECIEDFWKNGILKKLPVSSSNPTFIKAASQLRDSCTESTFCGKMLHEDYIRLFGRSEFPLAPAYASLYNTGTQYSTSQETPEVTEFYDSYGWESRFKNKIKNDHLGIELLFLTRLIEKFLVLDDDACQGEMRKEIRRFIDVHLFSWVIEWNRKVQLHSDTLCFKGIGTLIIACIEDIYSLFDQKSYTILSNQTFKN
jgi:putative dimethyl sulfoxide reductase chaperone